MCFIVLSCFWSFGSLVLGKCWKWFFKNLHRPCYGSIPFIVDFVKDKKQIYLVPSFSSEISCIFSVISDAYHAPSRVDISF